MSVQGNMWNVATDSQGVVLRMSWEQHRNDYQGTVASGNPDNGPRQAVNRRRKTPSKARRDRARWEAHQAKMAASSKCPPCTHEDVNSIFFNSETLLFLHQMFLKDLIARTESWPTLDLGK